MQRVGGPCFVSLPPTRCVKISMIIMKEQKKIDLLITNAAQVLTCMPSPGNAIGCIENGAVAIAGERIVAVGPSREVFSNVDASGAKILDAAGKVVAPGFVDCHTHLVFGGSRVLEYAKRLTHDLDDVKEELRKIGIQETGILATVKMTRSESVEKLTNSASQRIRQMLQHGTTTVESKSGYGLSLVEELKILDVNRRLQTNQPVDVLSTFLGAHAFPPDVKQGGMTRERYMDIIINEMIPHVAEQCLAEFCDVFCDKDYFSVNEARRILEAGRIAGLKPKIHADEYKAIGASELAAELHAVSADHLNHTKCATLKRLKDAKVVGVVMPMLDFAVRHDHPFDARAMLDIGMDVALATDLCPGCWVESMQLVMQFACRLYRFSPEEALCASTVGGARALGLDDRGTLTVGNMADIQIWNIPTFEDLVYRLGNNAVEVVIKRGRVVVPAQL